ncbi:MAG: nucleoside hydrolase [Niameybacter sp.]
MALLLAIKSEELEVVGITVCSGNVPARMGAKNALKVLALCGKTDIPVYVGEEVPLVRELVTAQDTHGEDGLGERFYEVLEESKILEGGVQYIVETLRSQDKVSIIALGPLTNIAKALMEDREAFAYLDEFISMGGAYRIHGNCSPVAEFNYWVDPHAADYVYQHLPRPVHMIGLDVTRKIVLTPNLIEFINRLDAELATFITEITRFYIDFHWEQEGIIGCVINDPLAVAYFMDRSLCQGFESYVEVVTEGIAMGQSIVDSVDFYKKPNNAIINVDVDAKQFMSLFLKKLFVGYENLIDSIIGGL